MFILQRIWLPPARSLRFGRTLEQRALKPSAFLSFNRLSLHNYARAMDSHHLRLESDLNRFPTTRVFLRWCSFTLCIYAGGRLGS